MARARKVNGATLRPTLGKRYVLVHAGHNIMFVPTLGWHSRKPISWRAMSRGKLIVGHRATLKDCVSEAMEWAEKTVELPNCSGCGVQLKKDDNMRDKPIYGAHGDLDYYEVYHAHCFREAISA